MKNKKTLVHVKVIDGSVEQIKAMSIALGKLKESMFDYEFLVTNENIELGDVGQLIKELWKLYKAHEKHKINDVQKVNDIEVKIDGCTKEEVKKISKDLSKLKKETNIESFGVQK